MSPRLRSNNRVNPVGLTLEVTVALNEALEEAKLSDGISKAHRLRGMAALWLEDPKLQARVAKRARELIREEQAVGRQNNVGQST